MTNFLPSIIPQLLTGSREELDLPFYEPQLKLLSRISWEEYRRRFSQGKDLFSGSVQADKLCTLIFKIDECESVKSFAKVLTFIGWFSLEDIFFNNEVRKLSKILMDTPAIFFIEDPNTSIDLIFRWTELKIQQLWTAIDFLAINKEIPFTPLDEALNKKEIPEFYYDVIRTESKSLTNILEMLKSKNIFKKFKKEMKLKGIILESPLTTMEKICQDSDNQFNVRFCGKARNETRRNRKREYALKKKAIEQELSDEEKKELSEIAIPPTAFVKAFYSSWKKLAEKDPLVEGYLNDRYIWQLASQKARLKAESDPQYAAEVPPSELWIAGRNVRNNS